MRRPLAKVSVATTRATASIVPIRVERTGTAARPAPGSNANRMPVTAGVGTPAAAAARAAREARARVC